MKYRAVRQRGESDAVKGNVYLLSGEGTASYKIGFTHGDVGKRAAVIQAYSAVPLRVLGHVRGTVEDERRLHSHLRRFRTHGEWFNLPEAIVWLLVNLFQCDNIPPEKRIG